MTQAAYPVVGVEDGSGTQPRLDLDDLVEKPIQFSLFIRALNKLQDMNSKDPLSPNYLNKPNSWWQMGAIHGLPYIPWSGDPKAPPQPDPKATWQGYCYHNSMLFPTWHRPLVMLVEQAVVNEAIAIATELEKDDPLARAEKWLAAAKTLRFPFWDWTKSKTAEVGIPPICQTPVISVANPGGTYTEVHNPLNHYRYAEKPGTIAEVPYMGDWERTYRWVNDSEKPTQEMYDQALKAFAEGETLIVGGEPMYLKPVSWLRGKVASMFTYDLTLKDPSYGPNMWAYFSTTGSSGVFPPMPLPMPSTIEESHNKIHLDTGGNGSMAFNEYASFDPIFFLHHCNVDRLLAFWEYLYPEYWMDNGWKTADGKIEPFTTEHGSYYQDPESEINHSTPLEPFPTQALKYWTSDDTRGLLETSPVKKYYTYPPIKDPRTGIEVKVDVPYDVKDLSLRQKFQQALYLEWGPDVPKVLHIHQTLSQNDQLSQHIDLLLKEEDGLSHLRHFVAIGTVPEFAFTGSYRLQLYLIPKDAQQTPVVINSVSVLGRGDSASCASCRDRMAAGSQVRGYMHIDAQVVLHLLGQLSPAERSSITSLDHVAVLIQGSLGMRLVTPDGKVLAASNADRVTVSPNQSPLEDHKTPSVTLHSHYIGFNPSDANVPLKFHDHTAHGKLGDQGEWKIY